jgi:hypothetical protein
MITLQIRVDDFIERVQRMDANLKQLPFALSLAMNRAATQTRSALIETTWPRGVTVRNTTFLRATLRMEFASKHDLSVAIYDSLGRASLPLHDKGGVKIGKGKLAIPLSAVRRTSRGAAAQADKPRNLGNSFVRNGVIYRVKGRGQRKTIEPMFALRRQARLRKRVNFTEDFSAFMAELLRTQFPLALARAVSTRR